MSDRIPVLINTAGAAGTYTIQIPDNYRFVTVLNTSGFAFNFYEGGAIDNANFLGTVQANDYRCIPLLLKNPMVRNNVLIQWTGAATTNLVQVIFSVDMQMVGGGAVGGVMVSNQGSPALIGNAWPVYLTIGGVAGFTLANPGRIDPTGATTQPVRPVPAGTQDNAWAAAAVLAGAESAIVELQYSSTFSAFGNSNAATTIELRVSQDGVTFYTIDSVILAVAGDFGFSGPVGARYVRLRTVGAATLSASICGK